MNKSKNKQLTPGLVDSIKKFANKSAKIGSVATVAAISSFSAANAANVTITAGGSITENNTTGATGLAIANNGTDALITASGAAAITATLDANAATKTASLISTSTATGVLTLNVISTTIAGQDFQITGALTVGASTDTDDTMVLNATGGDLILAAAVVRSNTSNTIAMGIAAGRNITATGNVNIDASFDGISDGVGILNVGHASTIDMKQAVGATHALATVLVIDDKLAIFDKDVSATTIDAFGKLTASGNLTGNVKLFDQAFTSSVATTNKTITGTISERSAALSVANFVNFADAAVVKTTITGTVVIDESNIGTTAKAGSAVFNSNATIVDLNMVGGNVTTEISTIELKGNLISATGVTFDDNTGTAKMLLSGTATQTLTGAIVGIGAAEGEIKVTNTSAAGVIFATAVGATTLKLADIDTKATFNAALGAATINNSGTMIVTGAAVATATISTGTTSYASTLIAATNTVSGGTATFGGKITASTGLIVSGANTIVNIGGAASDLGELDISAGTVNINIKNMDIGILDLNTTGEVVIADTIVAGDVVFIVTAQDAAGMGGSTGKVSVPINLLAGTTLIYMDGGGITAATAANLEAVLSDNALMDYQATKVAQDLKITTATKSNDVVAAELGLTLNEGSAMAQAFNAMISTAAEKDILGNVLNAKGGMTSTSDSLMASHVAPQTDTGSGSATATRAMTGTVQGIVSNRMASLRSGDAYVTGMSAGDGMSANSGFIQAFSSQVEQGNQTISGAKVYGYDAETSGVAIGFDGLTENGSTLGLSASFSSTDVDGLGVGKSKNSIDSYTVSVYADKSTDSGYLEGSLTYGVNDNSNSRKVNAVGIVRQYTGSFDSQQVSLKLAAGAPKEVSNETYLTPYASFTGTLVETDAYTEKSNIAADNLRLRVAQDSLSSMVGSAGVKVHKVTDKGTPMISFAVNQEFGDTKMTAQNIYQGGGTAFKTSTDIEELSATLGLGYSFGNDMTSLNIGYEGEMNDAEYVSHYGSIKLVSKF